MESTLEPKKIAVSGFGEVGRQVRAVELLRRFLFIDVSDGARSPQIRKL